MATGDFVDFVFAITVERSPLDAVRRAIAGPVEDDFLSAMSDT